MAKRKQKKLGNLSEQMANKGAYLHARKTAGRARVIPDGKKKQSKRRCRQKVRY